MKSRVIIFGGYYDISVLELSKPQSVKNDVVSYSESGWSKIGKLKTKKWQVTPIKVGGDIWVFGGGGLRKGRKHTEIWRVSMIGSIGPML